MKLRKDCNSELTLLVSYLSLSRTLPQYVQNSYLSMSRNLVYTGTTFPDLELHFQIKYPRYFAFAFALGESNFKVPTSYPFSGILLTELCFALFQFSFIYCFTCTVIIVLFCQIDRDRQTVKDRRVDFSLFKLFFI